MNQSAVTVDPEDQFVKAAQFARGIGLTPEQLMTLRRKYPDAWPSEFLRCNTTFLVRRRLLTAFVAECARRDAALPDPFADYARKGNVQRRTRT